MFPTTRKNPFGGEARYIPSHQGYGYPFQPQPGYSYPFQPQMHPIYQQLIYDQLMLGGRQFTPKIIVHSACEKKKELSPRNCSKSGDTYFMQERSGREVRIGNLKMKNKFFVNLKENGTFDAFCCTVEVDGYQKPVDIAIPYTDFIKHNITQHLPLRVSNEDCPDSYFNMAFFKELSAGDDIRFLQLPKRSGWQNPIADRSVFVSSESIVSHLASYYSKDIAERKVGQTVKNFADAAESLAKAIPLHWKYKYLLVIRGTSELLFFYGLAGLFPDHMFVIEPKSEPNAKTVAVLLNNKSPDAEICSLTSCKTDLLKELHGINDGMSLFRDTSYVEEEKKRNDSLNLLHKELYKNTPNSTQRTLTAIITDSLGNYSSEFSAFMLSLNDCPNVTDNATLQKKLFEFDAALIKLLSNSDITQNIVTNGLKTVRNIDELNFKEDYSMLQKMLLATTGILREYGLITDDEADKIKLFILSSNEHEAVDTNEGIVNEFSKDLSNRILIDNIKIYNQFGPPYFNPESHGIVFDGKYINITKLVLDRIIACMRRTKRRNAVLKALSACGKLHATKNYKRDIDIAVAPDEIQMVSVYSFPKSILSPKCMAKLDAAENERFLFHPEEVPKNFDPLLYLPDCNLVAGCVIDETTDEALSVHVSGKPRSGKTTFLMGQALKRAKRGEKVIIFDQSGAFTTEQLENNFSPDTVKKYFTHWDIGIYGIPVDLLSLEHCNSLPEKKNRLFSIFSVATKVTGDIQSKLLRKILSNIAKNIDSGSVNTLHDTLSFFDKEDPEQKKLYDRLYEVFEDIEGLNNYEQNLGEFLDSQGKIVVISTAADGIRKGSTLIDMLLASIYEYKQYHHEVQYTVILDEIDDMCLEKDGPISTILRKGSKHRIYMIISSQEYSVDKDKLGKLIGNCGYHVFFCPKDENLDDIAKHIGVDRTKLAGLEQGHCIIKGNFYDKFKEKNKPATLCGMTYLFE